LGKVVPGAKHLPIEERAGHKFYYFASSCYKYGISI
jgi:hypothetical protein